MYYYIHSESDAVWEQEEPYQHDNCVEEVIEISKERYLKEIKALKDLDKPKTSLTLDDL